jgi:hypothetical protein
LSVWVIALTVPSGNPSSTAKSVRTYLDAIEAAGAEAAQMPGAKKQSKATAYIRLRRRIQEPFPTTKECLMGKS